MLQKKIKKLILLSATLLLLFSWYNNTYAEAAAKYTEMDVVVGGGVAGFVKYGGDWDVNSLELYGNLKLPDTTDVISEKIVTNKVNNGLKNAIVSIHNIEKGKKKILPALRPIIDQQQNIFIPRITAIQTGMTIDILNGDEVMHNIHTNSIRNQPFNLGTTYKQRISIKFDYPEIIKLACDIHKQSYAWIVVYDHPYFDVTDRTGYFEICDIPPGTYKFCVWHEALGKLEKEVTISPEKIEKLEFVYSQN